MPGIILSIIVAIISIILSFLFGQWCLKYKSLKKETEFNEHIETLKNALLAYALNNVQRNDPDFDPYNISMDYASFDGTSLPMFSGCNLESACFSYFTKNPIMQHKQKAIELYLNKNLNSEKQIEDFFIKFLDSQKPVDKKDNQDEKIKEDNMVEVNTDM